MGSTFFISDVHLGMNRKKSEKLKERRLLSFLDYVAQYGERLFIVGDLFDFWFEYRTAIPIGFTSVLCALAQLRELGKEMHYIAGNHDFWMRNFLKNEFGITIHYDDVSTIIENRKFYLSHGDGLNKKDVGYRILKKVFRNRVNIFLYSLIHPDIGIPFAKWISSLSRKHTDSTAKLNDSDYIRAALQKFEAGYDYVIFGHLHTPKYQTFGQKVYINLGDWIEHFTYAEFDGENLKLLSWRG